MKRELYVELKVSQSSNYVSVEDMFFKEDLQEEYNDHVETMQGYGWAKKVETIKGYELQYIMVNVEYDGRKRKIAEEDVKQSLCKQGLLINHGSHIFGSMCSLSDELKKQLNDQLQQRKDMINKGEFVKLAS